VVRRWRLEGFSVLGRSAGISVIAAGVFVASIQRVFEKTDEIDRRDGTMSDRRKQSRNGRRRSDPYRRWRRLVWLIIAYVSYVSLRRLPASMRRLIRRPAA
jgi:hypothetical protein